MPQSTASTSNITNQDRGKGLDMESMSFTDTGRLLLSKISGYKSTGMLLITFHTHFSISLPVLYVYHSWEKFVSIYSDLPPWEVSGLLIELMGFNPAVAGMTPTMLVTLKAWNRRMFLPVLKLIKPLVKHQ